MKGPEARATIPIYDPRPEIEELWDDLNAAVQRVLRSGQFINGPEVKAFEEEVAEYLGVAHAVGLNSGTDALVIGLRALGIGPGDEVITTPFTFFATAEAISSVGATPVFVDIEPATFNVDAELIQPAITARTKAILPVHLYGHACDMGRITEIADEHELKVLEDTAQAFGATRRGHKAGAIGDAGAFSFFPTKNLGGFGDGGLLATDDDDVARAARMLRVHGAPPENKYANEIVGYNSRLDELQAAMLRVKLPRVDAANDARRRVAAQYEKLLAGVDGLVLPGEARGARHVYHQYTVRITDGQRDRVRHQLPEAGVQAMVYYPTCLHQMKPFQPAATQALPQSEKAAAEVMSLPMGPLLPFHQAEAVAATLARAVRGR